MIPRVAAGTPRGDGPHDQCLGPKSSGVRGRGLSPAPWDKTPSREHNHCAAGRPRVAESRSSCVCFNKSCKRSARGVLGHMMSVVSESLSGSSSASVSRGHPAWRRILRQVPRRTHSKGHRGDHLCPGAGQRKLRCLHGDSAWPGRRPGSTTAARTPAARALESTRRWEAAEAVQKPWLRTGASATRPVARGSCALWGQRQAARIAPVCPGSCKPVRWPGRQTERAGGQGPPTGGAAR